CTRTWPTAAGGRLGASPGNTTAGKTTPSPTCVPKQPRKKRPGGRSASACSRALTSGSRRRRRSTRRRFLRGWAGTADRSQGAVEMPIDHVELKRKVLQAARECAARGPGYAQQKPVLDEVAGAAGGNMWTRLDLDLQQAILTCWHDLFREGTLSWG